jgi:hypothetical protein|tara:strand:+ start:159 stop:344 length:186 start_codon:yes stop_codon:yes gene_type:complete
MEDIKTILMRRDGLSDSEADNLIAAAQEEFDFLIARGCVIEAEHTCQTWFGLEPDYLVQMF